MAEQIDVAVVILNFNGKYFLEKFLKTLVSHSKNASIYVADNCSTDDSLSYLKENFSNIPIILNDKNYGYADGYNQALKKIQANYFVLINNDIEVTENWIEPVLDLMNNNLKIAACQPKILDYTFKNKFEYAGASGGFIDKYGYPFCRGRVFNSIEEDNEQYNLSEEIFWASGACLFLRSSSFWEVGGLDGDYFAHMEEIDLCWRLKNVGYQIYVQPQSQVYHVGGGTLNKISPQKTFLNFRNNLSTLTKNHPKENLKRKIFLRLILDGVAGLKFLIEGQPSHTWAVWRAHQAYYKWIPNILEKRKQMESRFNFNYTVSKMYKGNSVLEHFIKKKNKFTQLLKGYF